MSLVGLASNALSMGLRLLTAAFAAVMGWACGWVAWAVHMPRSAAAIALHALEAAVELLAYLIQEPSHRQQVSKYRGLVARGQQRHNDMRQRAEALATQLQQTRDEAEEMQRANDQLRDQLTEAHVALEEAVIKGQRAAAAAAAAAQHPSGVDTTDDEGDGSKSPQPAPRKALYRQPGQGWRLHMAMALAALGLRWWLFNEEDPLQRKIMFAVLWPGVWLYAAIMLRCLPANTPLRPMLAAGCYFVLGYIAHEVLEHSLEGDSGLLRGLGDGPTRATKLLAAAGGRLQGRLQWLRGNATLGATEL